MLTLTSPGQLKGTTALHAVCCLGSDYPTQELLAALRQQTRVSYFNQKLTEPVFNFLWKVTGLANQHFLIRGLFFFKKVLNHLCSISPLPADLQKVPPPVHLCFSKLYIGDHFGLSTA